MDSTLKRTWAEIDLDALAHNYKTLRDRIGANVKFLGVVKADAYGHGSVQVSRLLQELGADYLAVSSIDEAIELRLNDITMPILILGHTPKEQVSRLIEYNITQAVTCKAKALEYSEEAVKCGGTLKIHIKVDTGMSRLGYLCDGDYFDTGVEGICEGCSLPGLYAEGIFTHFAVSDEPGDACKAYTEHQFQLFTDVIKNVEEKIGKLYVLRGNKPEEVTELHAGDIGALAKLSKVTTTDTLSTKANPVLYIRTQISTPYTCMRYKAKNKGDEDKISQTLQKLMQEDLTLKNVNDSENGQTLLYGMGDLHLEVTASKLLEKYKVEIELTKPKVAFRETIRKKADVEYKYKKQSGGHGQYGHVKMTFEPSGDLETPYVFEQTVVGGAVPKNYYPAVEKGLAEAVLKGPMAAYPVVGVKAVLYDGSYHPVDSSEMAFKTAAIQAFKKGFMEASPVLLEPISSLKVIVPDKYTGDVMGDLNKRRGRVLGMNPIDGGKQEILADVPTMELYGYTTSLRAITGGSGDYSYEFARYEQAPSDIQEKEIEARANKVEKAD